MSTKELSAKELTADDLIGAAMNLDAVKILIDDISINYFGSYDPDEQKNWGCIAYNFHFYRAKMNAVSSLLREMGELFNDLDIHCYNNDSFYKRDSGKQRR